MTLDENLQLLRTTKQNIKTALNDKIHESADNKPFGEYHYIVDGFKQGSNNIEDYTITDTTRLSEYTGDSFTLLPHIKSVNIPTTVTSLGDSCFNGCTSLSAVTIGNSVTSLGDSCFNGCTSLSAVTIPDSVTSLGGSCFKRCSSLTSVTIGNSVTSLGGSCFQGCTSLSAITIPDSVTSLGGSCFKRCSSLTSVTIGNSVTSLGDSCFEDCSGLKGITIPDSVTSIKGSHPLFATFKNCSGLVSVTCKAITPPTLESYAFDGCSSLSSIYVHAESVDAYKNATNWSTYADKIQAIHE